MSVILAPPLREARELLRQRGVEANVGELALAGARALLAEVEASAAAEERRIALRHRLSRRLREGDAFDVDALDEVRERGWTRA